MCEIDFSDGDPVAGYRPTWRKARKDHRCDCCGAAIAKGERYRYASWIYDHEPDWERACTSCADDMQSFGEAHGSFFFADSFEHYLDGCISEEDEEDRATWLPMLERLRARRAAAQEAARG